MRGLILGALILTGGTLAMGCRHDEAAQQETPSAEQPASSPETPVGSGGEGGGTGGSGSTGGGGEGSDVEARSVEITDDETVTQEDIGGSDAATERGMFDERNSEGADVQPLGNDEFQGH